MVFEDFVQRPVQVKAKQFRGWNSYLEIHELVPSVIYVPEGYEHPLRFPSECDRSVANSVRQDAPQFLIVEEVEGITMSDPRKDTHKRVDLFHWVVTDDFGRVVVMTNEDFHRDYVRNDVNAEVNS